MTESRASELPGAMRALHGEALLNAWERGSQQPRPSRALALLAEGYALSEPDGAALAAPVRDAALLTLRQRGDSLPALATCPSCAGRLEFTLSVADVARQLGQAASLAGSMRHGAWTLHCRFASTADVAAAAAEPALAGSRRVLLARCVSAEDAEGRAVPLADWPPALLVAADGRLVAMHEAAELLVSLACPACETMQQVFLDLAEYVWLETRHAAQRLLAEVHELAWAYGWAESAILGMSAPRRAAYLAMVRA